MYCRKCETGFEGNYCPVCGASAAPNSNSEQSRQTTPPSSQSTKPPINGGCPNCGSYNVQVVTETNGTTKGFGAGKGCLGAILFGPFGWLCGLCGMGKSKTSSNTFRVCGNCGRRFR